MSSVISTIIVNYNAGAFLRESVVSLLNSPLEIEVIVVDNASKDNSLSTLAEFPQIKIIKNEVNLGFAAACNVGLNAASSSTLFFLNPDCVFKPETLPILMKALYAEKDTGMVGGLLVNDDGSEQAGGRRAIPTPWRSFVRAFGLTHFSNRWPSLFFDFNLHKQPLPNHNIEVEAISGACMMVKCEAMVDVGPWDDKYFLHCEDLDWCMRFRQNKWKILFVPSAKVTHAQGACSKSRPVFVEWHKHKGMLRFYSKFFSHQYPGILMGFVALGVWLRFSMVVIHRNIKRIMS